MRLARIAKFLVVGIIGLSVNLGMLRLLVYLGMHYLIASILAFCLAAIVGFILQKFWTFESTALKQTHREFALYVGVALVNLAINTAIVYLLVEYAHAYYLIAQAVGAGLVAVVSYFIYRLYIFTDAS